MSKRPGPDDPGRPATAASGSPSEPGKLTSDDIFGEILEEVGGERLGASEPAREASRGPIKVQVSDPMQPGARRAARDAAPAPGASARKGVKELRPEDVDVLLDAFSSMPGEEAQALSAMAEPVAEQDGIVLDVEDAPLDDIAAAEAVAVADLDADGELDHEAAPPPQPMMLDLDGEEPPWMGMDDEESERLMAAEEPADASELPPPPPSPRARADDAEEGLRDLRNLMRLPKGREHKMGGGPNKFRAAAPALEAAPSLDLAAVAEQALDEAHGVPAEAEPPEPAPAGEIRYGPYRLLRRIAVGGMAEVFRAKRTGVEGFEKVVAVKRILPHLSDNKEFVDMFIDEAKMVAGLTHPNIVQIFDLGKIDRTYFIAMDYVHGRDLRTIMRRAREKGLRIPLDLSLLIVSRVCSALEFAHRKKDERGVPMQIVHRDVSPQNILISFEGEVKLTDFGIAKAATKATITDAGALRGKLLYMSPEQAWGKPMDRRSDVFSLGIVFYEMVTDQKPFLASSERSILETVRECRVAPPSEVNPRIPEKLERVVMKALARDVDERYQDAAEMYRDLERVLHERQPPTSAELSRFMEVLFDDPERSEVVAAAAAADASPSGEVHEEFEPAAPAQEAAPAEAEAEAEAEEPAPQPRPPARDPMSIQKLLKRFGIK
jgi:serine/threonine protein kinase